jgi:hypothetical protein
MLCLLVASMTCRRERWCGLLKIGLNRCLERVLLSCITLGRWCYIWFHCASFPCTCIQFPPSRVLGFYPYMLTFVCCKRRRCCSLLWSLCLWLQWSVIKICTNPQIMDGCAKRNQVAPTYIDWLIHYLLVVVTAAIWL